MNCPTAIAIDLDGTLLDSQHSITIRTSKAIRALSEKSIPVILVSARPPRSVIQFAKQLGLDGPHVALNGGLVISAAGEILERWSFEQSHVHALAAILPKLAEHSLSLYRDFTWNVSRLDAAARRESEIVGFLPAVGITSTDLMGAQKLLCILDRNESAADIVESFSVAAANFNVSISKPLYLEVCPPHAGKATALRSIAVHAGYSLREVAAVGDGENDSEMLGACGWAVAMGNAPESLKTIADKVVSSNDEDGVAQFVEEVLRMTETTRARRTT